MEQVIKRIDSIYSPILNFDIENKGYLHKILIVDDQSFNVDALMIIMKYNLGPMPRHQDILWLCSFWQKSSKIVINNPEKCNLILMDLNMPEIDGIHTM